MSLFTEPGGRADPAALEFRTGLFIDGGFSDSVSGRTFASVSPTNGGVLTEVAEGDAADIDRAVVSARQAFESGVWAEADPRERKERLIELARVIRANASELALLITLDMGKPISDAVEEVEGGAHCIQYFGEAIDKLYDEIAPTPRDALTMITREPLGVVGAVLPWNYPILIAAWKLAPALAAGNCVVVKPAEQAPLLMLRIAELAVEAGLPPGVLNVVNGFGETAGKALGCHPDVDGLSFTGSSEVGKLFLHYSGESNMKHVSLECGGKSPVLVFTDAPDLEFAASQVALNIFINQGEMCNAGSRLLVERGIEQEFVELVASKAANWQPGDPLDPDTRMGALVDEGHMVRVLQHVEAASGGGASVIAGGTRARAESGGFFVTPTVLSRVSNEMPIAQEEVFGPVLATIPFDDTDDAIRIANDSRYGLAAGLFSRDITKAHLIARRLRAGSVWINCYDHADVTVPFGGYKESGIGRDKSLHALEKYTQLKTTWINLGHGARTGS